MCPTPNNAGTGASNTGFLPILQCSHAEPAATIRTALELDQALHKAEGFNTGVASTSFYWEGM